MWVVSWGMSGSEVSWIVALMALVVRKEASEVDMRQDGYKSNAGR